MKTIDYYNKHAEEFTASTFEVDMESLYQPFLADLPEGARILDVGCGSGRDTLAFKKKGYQVGCQRHSKIDPFYLTNGKVKLTPLISY